MNLSGLPIFGVLEEKLKYHSARQAALAQNIANADTPQYKAQEIKAPDFKQMAIAASKEQNGGGLTVTNPMHVSGGKHGGGYDAIARKTTGELNPNGNNVVIEEEMMNVAQNQTEYQKSLMLYRKMIGMMNIAIGKPANGG